MKKYIINYIKENSKILTIFLICLFIGTLSGILIFQFSLPEVKEELVNSVKDTLNISKQDNYEGINIIKNGIVVNIFLISLIYFSIITIICPVIVSFINILKGVSIGLYISVLFNIFGASKGILSTILINIIPNIFYIPAFLLLCTSAVNMHFSFISKKDNKLQILVEHLIYIVIAFSFLFLSILFEQILSNNVINIYKNI